MKIVTIKPESLTSEQQAALEAVDNLCAKVRNQDHFSDADIASILDEMKGVVHTTYNKAFKALAF